VAEMQLNCLNYYLVICLKSHIGLLSKIIFNLFSADNSLRFASPLVV
jgi:hypothetical protein